MTATLPQATKLLQLAAKTTNDQLQAHLETGLLADLLAVEDPRAIDRAEFRKLLANQKLAKKAMSGMSEIGTFTLKPHQGKSELKHLVKAGNYGWTNDWITPERFPEKVIGPLNEEREILLVKANKFVSSEEMLAYAQENGLERPTAGDALRFGVEHPEEQRKYPIVFLHEPVLDPRGDRDVLVLDDYDVSRYLDLSWFGLGWHSGFVFAFVRKRKA